MGLFNEFVLQRYMNQNKECTVQYLINHWVEYQKLKVFTDASELFHDDFRTLYEMEDDCLAGIMISIENNPNNPFLKYFDTCVEGSTKLLKVLDIYVVKNSQDEEPRRILKKKLEMMINILGMIKSHYQL